MPQGPGARRAAAYRAAGDGGQGVSRLSSGQQASATCAHSKASDTVTERERPVEGLPGRTTTSAATAGLWTQLKGGHRDVL